jgi:hypothetical protein
METDDQVALALQVMEYMLYWFPVLTDWNCCPKVPHLYLLGSKQSIRTCNGASAEVLQKVLSDKRVLLQKNSLGKYRWQG